MQAKQESYEAVFNNAVKISKYPLRYNNIQKTMRAPI